MSRKCCPPVILGGSGIPGPEGPAGPPGPPGAAAQVLTGCGITGAGDETAPLTAATSGQWGAGPLALPCDQGNGQPVYCDAAGQLRTVPARYSRGFASNEGESLGGPPDPTGTVRLLFDIQLDVTNPSTCRDMMAQTRVNVNGITWTQTAGNEWALGWGISYSSDGSVPPLPGPQQVLIQRRIPGDRPSADTVKWGVIDAPVSGGGYGYIGPGQTVTARAALYLDFIATNPNPGADGRAPSWAANWFELYAEGHSL